jgi:Xaa-Pro dipeptidase
MLLNIERARATMEKYTLDAIIAAAPENVYYLSDFGYSHLFMRAQYGAAAAILPRSEDIEPSLLISEQDVPYLDVTPTWMPDVRTISSGQACPISRDLELTAREMRIRDLWADLAKRKPTSSNRQELLASVLTEKGLAGARLGCDDVRVLLELQERGVARSDERDAINVFREIRLVKTSQEIDILKEAARINEDSLRAAANLLREGVTMREVRNAWRCAMVLQDALPVIFYAGGFDRPWPVGDDSYRLKSGDHVLLDCAGTYKYYWADVGRTGTVGPASSRVKEVHENLLEISRVCVPMLRPEVTSAAIKEAARQTARDGVREGLSTLLHPLGVEIYEMPQPYGEVLQEDFTLEAGMVVSCEYCLYTEFPWGVVQLEDTYLIGDGEAEFVGTLPQTILPGDA